MSQDSNISNPETEQIRFSDLSLLPQVLKAITATGYETPSPIQAQAIPYLLEGRDILGVAQTGTGKTAAFALPLLSSIDLAISAPQILCLAPTRELAIQVAEAFRRYAQNLPGFKVLPIYGGADYRGQIRQLKQGVHVVVGTPGRVMDHMRRGTLKLDGIKALVLDEADEMLRMGFIDDVEWVLEQMPEQHQTALFSATMPPQIRKITDKYLQDPAHVTIKEKTTTASNIRQRFLQLNNNQKLDALTRIMEVEQFDGIIIFVRTKNATLEVAERLQARGYAAEALNGDIAQNQREKTVARLKKGNIDIIVATDVAARGLDVSRISHVVNYDVPYDTESYVHRIGRTGRAGREGDAILFVNGREKRLLQIIERATRQKIERFQFPSVDVLNERKIEQLFNRIDAELQKNLTEYSSVIRKYLKRNDVDLELLAAAIASLEGDSKPFYIKESAADKSLQKSNRDQPNKKSNKSRIDKDSTHRDDIPMQTYRLEVGETHGVDKGDIVGAIANVAGIESKYMGKIQLHKDHSFITLPEGMPKHIYKDLRKTWVRGQQLQISLAEQQSRQERKPRRKHSTKGKTIAKKKPKAQNRKMDVATKAVNPSG